MQFEPAKYGARVARVLACYGDGQRLMPLTCRACSCPQARSELETLRAQDLFPDAQNPEAAMAGLWLYFSCFDEAHQLADACGGPDGDFWHAIVHRQEPDSGNATYWFRRVGSHPIFPALAQESSRRAVTGLPKGTWDPYAFIAVCDSARQQPGSPLERAAMEIQSAEWQLLFDHCARRA